MAQLQQIIAKIQSISRTGDSPDSEQLRALAAEYSAACAEVIERLEATSMLLEQGRLREALELSDAEPNLLESVVMLDFPGRSEWVQLLDYLGIAPPPTIPSEAVASLEEAYLVAPQLPASAKELPTERTAPTSDSKHPFFDQRRQFFHAAEVLIWQDEGEQLRNEYFEKFLPDDEETAAAAAKDKASSQLTAEPPQPPTWIAQGSLDSLTWGVSAEGKPTLGRTDRESVVPMLDTLESLSLLTGLRCNIEVSEAGVPCILLLIDKHVLADLAWLNNRTLDEYPDFREPVPRDWLLLGHNGAPLKLVYSSDEALAVLEKSMSLGFDFRELTFDTGRREFWYAQLLSRVPVIAGHSQIIEGRPTFQAEVEFEYPAAADRVPELWGLFCSDCEIKTQAPAVNLSQSSQGAKTLSFNRLRTWQPLLALAVVLVIACGIYWGVAGRGAVDLVAKNTADQFVPKRTNASMSPNERLILGDQVPFPSDSFEGYPYEWYLQLNEDCWVLGESQPGSSRTLESRPVTAREARYEIFVVVASRMPIKLRDDLVDGPIRDPDLVTEQELQELQKLFAAPTGYNEPALKLLREAIAKRAKSEAFVLKVIAKEVDLSR